MIVQFQKLLMIQTIDNSVSYHASQVLSTLVGLNDMYLHKY